MDQATMLAGVLPVIVLVSAVLSALISVIIAVIYRRAVIRFMSRDAEVDISPTRAEATAAGGRTDSLTISTFGTNAPIGDEAMAIYAEIPKSLRRVGRVYLLAGLGYAVILSLAWMISAGDGFHLMRFLWLMVSYAWPTVITLQLVTIVSRRESFLVFGIYGSLLVSTAIIILVRNPSLDVGELTFLWLSASAASTLLWSVFRTRSIRVIGPLVLAFVVTGVAGAYVVVAFAFSSDNILMGIAIVGNAMGFNATSFIILLTFILSGGFGWLLLDRIGRAYQAKRISDQSISIDTLWLVFGILQSITLALEGWAWIFTGVVAFGAYKLITHAGFKCMDIPHSSGSSFSLFMLRVFSLGRRSERLFNRFSKRWLRIGDINLIAGPDLATSTINPNELHDFVRGHMSSHFIGSHEDLHQRIENRDRFADPDGRYRVNEFFCHRNTWQMTMQQLAAENQVVMMDLRSFSNGNQGCLWELEQLLTGVALERVILLLDSTTDRPLLEKILQETWKRLPDDSVNTMSGKMVLRLLLLSGAAEWKVNDVVKQVIQACLQVKG